MVNNNEKILNEWTLIKDDRVKTLKGLIK